MKKLIVILKALEITNVKSLLCDSYTIEEAHDLGKDRDHISEDIAAFLFDKDKIAREELTALRRKLPEAFPVLLVSERFTPGEVSDWLTAGASDLIVTPLEMGLLKQRLEILIRLYTYTQNLKNQDLDELTGLYNRKAFYRHAEEMIQDQPESNYTLIISDIDEFKRINSRYGEDRGDKLLRYVGQCLGQMNGKDILFARYSGDQFVGLMRQIFEIDEKSDEPLILGMQQMQAYAPIDHFEVKFGIYDHVDHEIPISMMCDRAMMALRSIKHQYGRTLAKYNQRMQQYYLREQQIQECMEEALEKEQFQVYYQPKHDTISEELVGAEALVRWIHPIYGFMSPAEFIPLFERNGFISQLDYYVWEKVCQDQAEWIRKGFPVVPISVNASRKDLLQNSFLEKTMTPLNSFPLSPSLFHMEITESLYIEDYELLIPLVQKIQNQGINIELDDFGSGFSSLSILNKIPLNIIKLDISFVRNLDQQKEIVASIIDVAHKYNYQIVAEGVETDDQLETLRKLGCDIIQGYYYSKPLPRSGFEDYMMRYKK